MSNILGIYSQYSPLYSTHSNDNLRGAEANPGGAVATKIAALQLQVAELTQRLQSAVKIEVVSDADKQSVKNALEGLDGMKPWRCSIPRRKCNSGRHKERCCS